MRRDLNTCSSQSAMYHGVPVRVFLRRSSEHHSRNDSSSSTSWSHDSHVFSHSRTLVVPGTFLRVLYNNIHHVAFARELEEKEKKHRAGPTSSTFHFSFSCGIVYSRGNRTPESEIKQTSVYLIKRKMKKKFHIHTWHTHTTVVVHLSTRRRHQVKMEQTGSEPPNRHSPELLVIHTKYLTNPCSIPL